MFGNLAQMAQLMGKAKDIQKEFARFREELPGLEFSAVALGGAVKVTVSGDFSVKSVEIAPEAAADPLLPGAIQTAMNSALGSARLNIQEQLKSSAAGFGLNVPGLF